MRSTVCKLPSYQDVERQRTPSIRGRALSVGPLIREVQTDVIAEEADRIAKALLAWAKPKIERGVVRGIPMWWKERLAREQFSE